MDQPQNQKPFELITLKGFPRGSGYYDTTKTLWTWFVKPWLCRFGLSLPNGSLQLPNSHTMVVLSATPTSTAIFWQTPIGGDNGWKVLLWKPSHKSQPRGTMRAKQVRLELTILSWCIFTVTALLNVLPLNYCYILTMREPLALVSRRTCLTLRHTITGMLSDLFDQCWGSIHAHSLTKSY